MTHRDSDARSNDPTAAQPSGMETAGGTNLIRPGRRGLLAASGVAALSATSAQGSAPFRRDTAPAWYRFAHGSFELTVVSDGPLSVGAPQNYFLGATEGEMAGTLRAAYLPTAVAVIGQNALVLNTGRHLVLFDTGMGESMGSWSRMFGPGTGRMLANLRAAGIEPGQIDLVALTHPHSDHCWALTDAQGRPNFPNAQVAVSEADFAFWTDDGNKRGPEVMSVRIEGAKQNLGAYRDRLIMVRDGQEVVPGSRRSPRPGIRSGTPCMRSNRTDNCSSTPGTWRIIMFFCSASRDGRSLSTPTGLSRRARVCGCSTASRRTAPRSRPGISPGRDTGISPALAMGMSISRLPGTIGVERPAGWMTAGRPSCERRISFQAGGIGTRLRLRQAVTWQGGACPASGGVPPPATAVGYPTTGVLLLNKSIKVGLNKRDERLAGE
ncbi:MBL fold metallo-hydrolase, partial [Teichococcus wenyumeiae]